MSFLTSLILAMKLRYPSFFKRLLILCGFALVVLCAVGWGLMYALTFHPKAIEDEVVYNKPNAPVLKAGQELKVMSWNVQYMAGKNYTFFYDVANGDGPHERPSVEDLAVTFKEVARIIKEVNPDVILLQEVDSGAKRTDYEDQLSVLMELLPEEYRSYCSTYYWKNKFNPHPRIMGATGLKLAIISKYKMSEATRHQLSSVEWTSFFKDFSLKRAILKVRFPVEKGRDFFAINTHLSAFSQGTDTMKRQVLEVVSLLDSLEQNRYPWAIGGDFNLLPPGQYEGLSEAAKYLYQPDTELLFLTSKYPCIPQIEDCQGREVSKWFTHFSNDPVFTGPDRTLDYIFHSKHLGQPLAYEVRHGDTLKISDHLPVVSSFRIP